jgi:hypothetical protein
MIGEKEIIEILNDDKNYKDVKIYDENGWYQTFRELDYPKVAKKILDKIKKDEKRNKKVDFALALLKSEYDNQSEFSKKDLKQLENAIEILEGGKL